MSDCESTRAQLLDGLRDRLAEPARGKFKAHLEGCRECRALFEREQVLDRALEQRPRFALPEGLRERLAAQAANRTPAAEAPALPATERTGSAAAPPGPALPRRRFTRWAAVLGPSLAAALLTGVLVHGLGRPQRTLTEEAINDHLRVLYAQHPIEIESGGIHQVKPWFAGKLDFAPVLEFSGDEEFPLQGGAIALFVDRRAATFVFKHRLHTATLFVFQKQGLESLWPTRAGSELGRVAATRSSERGFNVLIWEDHGLGYALVSDMDPSALTRLAGKLTGG